MYLPSSPVSAYRLNLRLWTPDRNVSISRSDTARALSGSFSGGLFHRNSGFPGSDMSSHNIFSWGRAQRQCFSTRNPRITATKKGTWPSNGGLRGGPSDRGIPERPPREDACDRIVPAVAGRLSDPPSRGPRRSTGALVGVFAEDRAGLPGGAAFTGDGLLRSGPDRRVGGLSRCGMDRRIPARLRPRPEEGVCCARLLRGCMGPKLRLTA